jgi:hypothetical protein
MDAEVTLREVSVTAPGVARLPRIADRLAKLAKKIAKASREVLRQPVLPLEALMEASVLAEQLRRRTAASKDPLAQPLFKGPLDFPGLVKDLEPGQAAGMRARHKRPERSIDDPFTTRFFM